MNIKEIKEILGLMKEHGLSEVEIEKDGLKVKLRKNMIAKEIEESGIDSSAVVIPLPKTGETTAKEAEKAKQAPQDAPDVHIVKSPMVGTFYAAPAPDQPPYVTLGQSVKKGDVLCIVEAMKLMNEIKCESNGTLVEVLVTNGQAVEFDQSLFKIKMT